MLFKSAWSSVSTSFAKLGDVFVSESSARIVDGFSMVEVDAGAVEARFVRLCSSADLFGSSGLLVMDLDSAAVRSASFSNKHRQGWSLSRHMTAHVRHQDGFRKQAGVSGPGLSSHPTDFPPRPAPAEPVPLQPNS